MYKTVTVDVEVDIDDIIDDMNTNDLIEELERRGYITSKEPEEELLTDDEKDFVVDILLKSGNLYDQTASNIYEKLRKK